MTTDVLPHPNLSDLLGSWPDPYQQAGKLRETIAFHADLYHNHDNPIITDHEYDRLYDRLVQLEADHPECGHPDSPTNRVQGSANPRFARSAHAVPMLGLANAFEVNDVATWYDRTVSALNNQPPTLVAEPKIDGLAARLTYRNGHLVTGATRGDGIEGEDITHNLKDVQGLPTILKGQPPRLVEIRGELYLPIHEFLEANRRQEAAGAAPFASARNAAAGAVRKLEHDAEVAGNRNLSFWAYTITHLEPGHLPQSQWEALAQLGNWGFAVVPHNMLCQGFEEVIAFYEQALADRHQRGYEADGIVIKVDVLRHQEELGDVGREPRWALAWKFPAEQTTTRLKAITISVGKSGALTPQAVLEPVIVSGVTISSATLHNEADIRRKDIREGDLVTIQRAGDVIPQVIGPVDEPQHWRLPQFRMPERCPSCNGRAVKTVAAAVYHCVNPECADQLAQQLAHFVSRDAMDIRGIGPQWSALLIRSGAVRGVSDLYRLDVRRLLALPGMGETLARSILESIEASKNQPLARVLFGLGIQHVGISTAGKLADTFHGIQPIVHATANELVQVAGIRPFKAESITKFFASPRNTATVDALIDAGLKLDEPREVPTIMHETQNPWTGLNIVVTGKLDTMTRAEAEGRIRGMGATAGSSVTRATTHLVYGENAGSKLAKAEKLALPTMSEREFLHCLAEPSRLVDRAE